MFKTLALGVAVLGLATAAQAANLVTNPGFEMSVGADAVKASGSTDVSGWTITRGGAFLASASSWAPSEGMLSLELAGTAPGSVYQQVALNEGTKYVLRFDFAADPATTRRQAGVVSVGSLNFSIEAPFNADRTPTNMLWTPFEVTFFAPTDSARLSFVQGSIGTTGLTIDNVFLSIVPEPATWGLLIAGFGMVGFAIRRRRVALNSVSA